MNQTVAPTMNLTPTSTLFIGQKDRVWTQAKNLKMISKMDRDSDGIVTGEVSIELKPDS